MTKQQIFCKNKGNSMKTSIPPNFKWATQSMTPSMSRNSSHCHHVFLVIAVELLAMVVRHNVKIKDII